MPSGDYPSTGSGLPQVISSGGGANQVRVRAYNERLVL